MAITNRQNPIIQEIRQISRDDHSPKILLEGIKLIAEAVRSKRALETVVVSTSFLKNHPAIRSEYPAKRWIETTDSVFDAVSSQKTPIGILGVAGKPAWTWNDMVRHQGPLIVLDGIQEAGNAASIVRTAEAAGFQGVITTPGTARLFTTKALRGAMGSSLRLPILEHQTISQISETLLLNGYQLYGASSQSGSEDCFHMKWGKPLGLVLGQESRGLSDQWKESFAGLVHIPMKESVESLNVGAAAAILLYACRNL